MSQREEAWGDKEGMECGCRGEMECPWGRGMGIF